MKKILTLIFLIISLYASAQTDTLYKPQNIGQIGRNQRVSKGLIVPDTLLAQKKVVLNCYKNNASEDSILTTDTLGNLKQKISPAIHGVQVVAYCDSNQKSSSLDTVLLYIPSVSGVYRMNVGGQIDTSATTTLQVACYYTDIHGKAQSKNLLTSSAQGTFIVTPANIIAQSTYPIYFTASVTGVLILFDLSITLEYLPH